MIDRDESDTPGAREFLRVDHLHDLPAWADRPRLEHFLHEQMKPWQDPPRAIRQALDDCLEPTGSGGGFLLLCRSKERLAGACVMLRTGMSEYVPEWLLLMVGVAADLRGQGIGAELVRRCVEHTGTGVKLHVEPENPARHLYERLGFRVRYAEMRYTPADS
jgi:ribosomal-protein-alanine N-acetyltransferase